MPKIMGGGIGPILKELLAAEAGELVAGSD